MKIQEIFKRYDNGFELSIPNMELNGNIIGVLGHIGSGKTSLLKTISRLNNGRYEFITNEIIYMIEYDKIPNSKISLIRDVYAATNQNFDKQIFDELTSQFDIDVNNFSSELREGQRKILSFMLTISVDSEILLLDEPFSKIDPYNRKIILNYIIQKANKKNHIIIASHEISNLQRIIDQAILIKDGRIINSSSIENIEKNHTDIKEWYRENYME